LPTSPQTSTLTELLFLPVEAHRLRLEAATATMLRLSYSRRRELENRPSHAVLPREWETVAARKGRGGNIELGDLTIRVGSEPFSLTVTDKQGRTRFATAPAQNAGRYSDEDAGNSPFEVSDDGLSFSRQMHPNELAYGFGEVGENLNRAGSRFSLWNHDDVHHTPRQNFYCQVPFGIHFTPAPPAAKTAAANHHALVGMFLDNPGRVEIDLGRTTPGIARYHLRTGDLVLWLIFGDSFADILRQWTDLTGHMERPPLWALGYHQCRYSYYPEKQVRSIAREFRKREIPCDVLYLDIHYMDEFRPFTWDPKRFPNPDKLITDLGADGFRVVTIVDPGIKVDPADAVFQSFLKKPGYFCEAPAPAHDETETQRQRQRRGDAPLQSEEVTQEHRLPPEPTDTPGDLYFTGTVWPGTVHFPDFLQPEVRKLWGKHQQRILLENGISGIWNDMNEPAVFDTASNTFPDDVLHQDFGIATPHAQVHQVYGMNMARASYEGYRAARSNDRPFIITRSGWAGVQRYSMVWTGDNHSSWASMLLDIQLNLSMGLTGISMVGCDIGGFIYDGMPELFARWIEWGVFQPFCRTHTAIDTLQQEPWSYGAEVERVAREMIGLRMRLLPYLYTLFAGAAENGTPVNRPLVWHYPDDPRARTIADQFFLGPHLMIVPILRAEENERLAYFPAGKWVHFFTGEMVEGPATHIVQGPLGTPPVYVRAGAVIPMHVAVRQHTAEPEPPLVLHVYPSDQIHGRFVEDDGSSRRYQKGEQLVYEFSGNMQSGEMRLGISAPRGRFRSPRKSWSIHVHAVDFASASVHFQNKPLPTKRVPEGLTFEVPVSTKAIEVTISAAEIPCRKNKGAKQ